MSERVILANGQEIGFPESALERELIGKYLSNKGYKMADLKTLSKEEVHGLMQEACRYAALRLAEIEARSGFCRKVEATN